MYLHTLRQVFRKEDPVPGGLMPVTLSGSGRVSTTHGEDNWLLTLSVGLQFNEESLATIRARASRVSGRLNGKAVELNLGRLVVTGGTLTVPFSLLRGHRLEPTTYYRLMVEVI